MLVVPTGPDRPPYPGALGIPARTSADATACPLAGRSRQGSAALHLDNFGVRTYDAHVNQDSPSPLESPPLDRRIATGLHKLGLALKHQTWNQASAHGLSPTQGQILAALAADQALSTSEVAARLGVGVPTVSEAVTTLEKKGYLRRRPDPRHPRARLLRLTAAGTRLAAHARAWPEFLTQAVGALTDAEQSTLLTALIKMIRSLQEQGQIPISRMCVTCLHFQPHVHDGDAPHHCAFVDAPMGAPHLRLDCADHEPAPEGQQRISWIRFANAG